MTALKFTALGAFTLLAALVFVLCVMWSDAVDGARITRLYTLAVATIGVVLLSGGLILAGDAAFLRKAFWRWLNHLFSSRTGLLVILVTSTAGNSIAGMGLLFLRPVVFSAGQSVILVNHDTRGAPRDIATIDTASEQRVLLWNGTRLLGYRIIATECTGALPPITIPSLLEGRVPRIHVNTHDAECNHETLEPTVYDHPVVTPRSQ